jgi:hypothetical protein
MIKKLVIFIMVFVSINSHAETGEVSRTVNKLVNHQYLDDSDWDNQKWFCLNDSKQIGSCSSSSSCGGGTILMISKNADSSIFSTVLAAKMSNSTITVSVDDGHKILNHCVARTVTI